MDEKFNFTVSESALNLLNKAKSATLFERYEDLAVAALGGGAENLSYEVAYEVPGKGGLLKQKYIK